MKKALILLAAVLVIVSCEKVPEAFDTLSGERPLILGHGGSGQRNFQNPHPWNSEQSIYAALASGADGVEVDVQLSADGVLMLFHDEGLLPATVCDGCIHNYDSADLVDCPQLAGIFQSDEEYPILRLDELLVEFSALNELPVVCLDLRVEEPCSAAGISQGRRDLLLSRLVAAASSYPRINITSADRQMLQDLADRDINAGLFLERDFDKAEVDDLIAEGLESGIDGALTYDDDMSPESVRLLHEAGFKVILFGPFDELSHRDALRKSPDVIITDNVTLLVSLLD